MRNRHSLSFGRSELQLPGLVARKEERGTGPPSLVDRRMPTRRYTMKNRGLLSLRQGVGE